MTNETTIIPLQLSAIYLLFFFSSCVVYAFDDDRCLILNSLFISSWLVDQLKEEVDSLPRFDNISSKYSTKLTNFYQIGRSRERYRVLTGRWQHINRGNVLIFQHPQDMFYILPIPRYQVSKCTNELLTSFLWCKKCTKNYLFFTKVK